MMIHNNAEYFILLFFLKLFRMNKATQMNQLNQVTLTKVLYECQCFIFVDYSFVLMLVF